MKSKNDKQMWEKKLRNRESQTEVDNGVHPLHWATSPGPSPMGTDPINGFKWCKKGSGINFSNCKIECWTESLQESSLWNYNLVFNR